MTAAFVDFVPVVADDVGWIAAFVHANAWPFHALHHPNEEQAGEIAARGTADDHLGWFAVVDGERLGYITVADVCLLYTSPSPRD